MGEIRNIVSKWKKIIYPKENDNNTKAKTKTKSKINPPKNYGDDFPEDYLIEGAIRRNNARKNLYKNLKVGIKDEDEKEELIQKVINIEDKLYEKYKGEGAYINRVLEIIHNLKDENNNEFREKIISGIYDPEYLAIMDENEMVNKNEREKIKKNMEDNFNSVRSDWDDMHIPVTEGVYKCRKCGGKKTRQIEKQIRSADEPMTIFITCVTCGNSWRC